MSLLSVPKDEPEALSRLRAAEAGLPDLSPAAVPAFIGELERLKTLALARLIRPATTEDRVIHVSEAAKLLSISEDTIYRGKFPFVKRKIVAGRVLCSYLGVQKYIRNSS